MKIRTRGNKNADETTDIVFTIKSTNQCYRATMARLNMFTKNPSEPPEQMAIVLMGKGERAKCYFVMERRCYSGQGTFISKRSYKAAGG